MGGFRHAPASREGHYWTEGATDGNLHSALSEKDVAYVSYTSISCAMQYYLKYVYIGVL